MDNHKPRIHEIEVIAGDVGYGKSAEVDECGVHCGVFGERVPHFTPSADSGDGYSLRTLVE